MYQTIKVKLVNLLLSLSDALDLVSPLLSQHQIRTSFVTHIVFSSRSVLNESWRSPALPDGSFALHKNNVRHAAKITIFDTPIYIPKIVAEELVKGLVYYWQF